MVTKEEVDTPAEKRARVSNESTSTARVVKENRFVCIIVERELPSSSNSNSILEDESNRRTPDEDLDTISAFMQLATEEISSSKCKEIAERITSSFATKQKEISKSKDVEILTETESHPSAASGTFKINSDLTSTTVDETLIENELTEKELSMIIEDDPLAEDPQTKEVLRTSSKTPSTEQVSAPKTLDNLISDTSKLLLDYELRIQGKYMCDVIEIPEHILVITIPKAKELRLSNSDKWLNNEEKQIPRSLLDIPADISVTRTLSEETRKVRGAKSFFTEDIDYVYYMGEDETPRRDRDIQVDIETTTKDSESQCDAEFDISLMSSNSKLRPNCPADLSKRECLVCGEILPNYSAQVKHFALHDNSVPSLCSYCGVTFSSAEKLLAHEKYFHSDFIYEAMRCPKPFCSKAFYSKKQLHDHIEEHIGNLSYKCYICLRTFNSSLQLFRHQRTSKFCLKRKQLKQNMFFRRMLEC